MAATHEKFYNVTKAVGPSQPNASDDVYLVQFFLKEIGEFWQVLSPNPNPIAKEIVFNTAVLKPITLNGVADQNLYNWIRWFQTLLQRHQGGAPPDGIVSPAPSRNHKGKQSRSIYTICGLNNLFESFFRQRWDNLPADGKAPAPLKAALSSNRE
jgi:hypothetical protein